MGKVYSPEAVEAGRVPEPGAHYDAGKFILDMLSVGEFEDTADDNFYYVRGVMVYGSTALGTANIRSDVDVLFTYDMNAFPGVLESARSVFVEAERRFHTSVEPQAHGVVALFDSLQHSIDPAFAAHLRYVQEVGAWSRNWPVDGLYTRSSEEEQALLRPAALRFAAGKRRQFARALLDYRGEVNLQVFQRALELPNAIGRKVLSFELGIDDSVSAEISRDKSGTLDKTYQRMNQLVSQWGYGPNQKGPAAYLGLATDDDRYTRMLQGTIDGKFSIDFYKNWIKRRYQQTVKSAYVVSDFWADVIKDRYDIRDKEQEDADFEARMANMPEFEY